MITGMASRTMSGIGSRRRMRSSLRAIAALRRGDIEILGGIALSGECDEDALEAGSQQLDAGDMRGARPELAHDRRDRAGRVVGLDGEDLLGDGPSIDARANRVWHR